MFNMKTTLNRLQFLRSSLSALGFAAVPGSRLWAAPAAWRPSGKPALVFGFITDSHIRRDGDPKKGDDAIWPRTPDTYLRNALTFFRDAGVDAVLHGGDMAHRGLRCEMQFHANVWKEIFPNDRLPDGRKVERLFVSGNHEWNRNNNFEFKVYPDPAVCERNVLHNDMPRHWREVWGEPYEKAWHKVVKGYHFFGEHWEDAYGDVVPLFKKYETELKGTKPFFHLQHLMPGAGEGDPRTAAALKDFPNAVVFFGHWHNTSAHLGTLHHETCVMVNGPSLRSNDIPKIPGFVPDARTRCDKDLTQHGYLVRVYKDVIVFERHDFHHGGKVGPDLVLPLGDFTTKAFAPEQLAKRFGAPAFPAGASLKVADAGEFVTLDIPAATARPEARVYAYDVMVTGAHERRLNTVVYAAGCDYAADHPLVKGPTRVRLNPSQLPGGDRLAVAVRPVTSLGTAGAACTAQVKGFFPADAAVLKVGTFNIRTAALEAKDPVPWKTRAPWVARCIQAHDFDLLGLQEVVAQQLDDLADLLKRDFACFGVCRDDGKRAGEAAPIFYRKARFELLDSGNFWLSEQPDVPGVKSWDTAFTRLCTWGKFKDRVTGKMFVFANTHLDHRGKVAKQKGMELIFARLKPFLAAGLPGLVTGDFNTVEGEGPYNVAAAQFRDAVKVSATPPAGPWRSAHGWRYRKEADELSAVDALKMSAEARLGRAFHDQIGGHRIDHVFVSPNIKVRSVTTYTDADGRTYVSDHFPVSAVVSF